MTLKTIIKTACIFFSQRLLHVFCVCPIQNNKMLFCSFDGRQYADSPKFISEYYRHDSNIIKVWAFDSDVIDRVCIPKDVIKVKKNTILYYYHFFTAKEIVINDFISSVLKLRKGQILLNTWHGGGSFKTVGFTSPTVSDYDAFFYKTHAENTTAYVLSSEFFGRAVINDSFHFNGTLLKTGTPRNSVLFEHREDIKERVKSFYNLNNLDGYTLVLYAPTYRSKSIKAKIESSENELDVMRCCNAIELKFGKPVKFIYRAHHVMDKRIIDGYCLDGTAYPDIQDLVYTCDILISDYSSCMWDFAIMKKPIFQFVPDLIEYTNDRNFLMPLREWNFIVSESNDELVLNISSFNEEKYKEGLSDYLKRMNSFENVNATNSVCAWLDTYRERVK